MASPLLEHLEDYLGEMDAVWPDSPDGERLPFTIARFGGVFETYLAYTKIGLSGIRQEFLLLSPEKFGDREIPKVLQGAARVALDRQAPLTRGEVVELKAMFDGYPFTALYVALPVYFPEEFAHAVDAQSNPVTIAWVVPVTTAEVEYVKQHGWSKFEDLLTERDPDLADLARSPVVS